MGGGEVACYIVNYGTNRIEKVGAVPPFLYKSVEHPEGVLDDAAIQGFENGVKSDRLAFLDEFARGFFANGDRTDLVSEPFRLYNRDIAASASPKGTLDCIAAFSKTLAKFNILILVIHGDSDATVPFKYSGKLTPEAIPNSKIALIKSGLHGFNATHGKEFNEALLSFLTD